jgi:hypothetical protein
VIGIIRILMILATVLGFAAGITSSLLTQPVAACVEVDPCAAYPSTDEPGIAGTISPATLGITVHDFKANIKSRLVGEPNELMVFEAAPDWYYVRFVYTGDESGCPTFDMTYPVQPVGTDVHFHITYYIVHPGGDKAEPASTEQEIPAVEVCEMEALLIW